MPNAPAVPPLSSADQRQLAALLSELRGANSNHEAILVFERLVESLPTLRQRLTDEQRKLLGELDQTETALDGARNTLHELFDHYQHEWRDMALETLQDVVDFEAAMSQFAQQATEVALRAGQRVEVLRKIGGV
jgi:predicted  nucleic acid-binding Zn-ribbon protein